MSNQRYTSNRPPNNGLFDSPTTADIVPTPAPPPPHSQQSQSYPHHLRHGNKKIKSPSPTVYFDPYSPVKVKVSLLDAEEEEQQQEDKSTCSRTPITTPGTPNFLEMEEPDDSPNPNDHSTEDIVDEEEEIVFEDDDDYGGGTAPIQTDSGLLLTHRRTPEETASASRRRASSSYSSRIRSRRASPHSHHQMHPQQQRLELEAEDDDDDDESWYPTPYSYSGPSGSTPAPPRGSALFLQQQYYNSIGMRKQKASLQRWLSYVRLWVVVSALVLLMGTVVVLKHIRHETQQRQDQDEASSSNSNSNNNGNNANPAAAASSSGRVVTLPDSLIPDRIILLPIPESALLPHPNNNNINYIKHHPSDHHHRHLLDSHHHHNHDNNNNHNKLHDLFVQWKQDHGKHYSSHEEHSERFRIWNENRNRIQLKNQRHGPCRSTKQPVFGLNHLSDLSEDEFRQQYLSGYGAPPRSREATLPVLDPQLGSSSFKRARSGKSPAAYTLEESSASASSSSKDVRQRRSSRRRVSQSNQEYHSSPARQRTSWGSCDWYDVSCYLRYIFETYFYGMGRTMEPNYDADSYPMAVDWRTVGAVTDVHSQGNCGACWAITASETVESAHFLSTGELVDLSETEIIVCADECEMCSGGWPQNAFEYIMDQKGIPLESDLPYDGDYLLQLTQAKEAGDQDSELQSYMQQICPSGGNKGSHSGDKNSNNDGGSSSRYGNIKGYGYATEKCVCYTDGSGCDCDSQNEGLAVRNVATYGPAVVCVDASTWQDYKGGTMTASSGCSSKFMDVNHCVQVVGYAFTTGDEEDGEEQQNSRSGDHSGSRDDGENRVGYWIVRNQWSSYWGMSGYAYVSMGENTCGILNDMIQVYGE